MLLAMNFDGRGILVKTMEAIWTFGLKKKSKNRGKRTFVMRLTKRRCSLGLTYSYT